MCVDLDYPHMRFAHRVVGSNASGVELRVDVVYPQNAFPVWTAVKQFDGFQGSTVGSGWRITPDVDVKPDWGGPDDGRALRRVPLHGCQEGRDDRRVHDRRRLRRSVHAAVAR